MSTDISQRWSIGNEHNQVVGPDLASAATIAPTHKIHYVTGTAEIATITLPYTTFSGDLVLVPDNAFTTATSGNIATAVTAVANRPLILHYLPAKGKWYIHAVA
jgi:hypothetical protein